MTGYIHTVVCAIANCPGGRCSRNCYNCPSCTAPLTVTAVPQGGSEYLKPAETGSERYMLQCQYCDWSSVDVDIVLSKPTKITEQLARQRKARLSASSDRINSDKEAQVRSLDHDEAFAKLTTFYKEQLNETSDAQHPYPGSPYGSPANLQRIMSLYGGLSANTLKKSREKPQPMREARGLNEGCSSYTPTDSEDALVVKVKSLSWEDTTSASQRFSAPLNNSARFVDQLWPAAVPLRTRRGRRCKTCRQFVSRPDSKVSNLRWKIRIPALNHIPRLLFKPLHPSIPPIPNPAFRLRADDPVQADLQPHVAQQYVLTIRNPIFETIKVTLATPAATPGEVASRITILCPSFTVGPAGDVWDEALSSSTTSVHSSNDGSRQAAMASLTGKSAEEADRQPEAGKIWERTRNSTSVIIEIVPGQLKSPPSIVPKSKEEKEEAEDLEEDDDVLEVPIFVRAEWEAPAEDEAPFGTDGKGDRERTGVGSKTQAAGGEKVAKELAFWCVLGVGRIAGG